MSIKKEKIRVNAVIGILASVVIFVLLVLTLVIVSFFGFQYIDSYPPNNQRVKSFIDFFDHPGINGFTLLQVAFVADAGFFILSLFFFVKYMDTKDDSKI